MLKRVLILGAFAIFLNGCQAKPAFVGVWTTTTSPVNDSKATAAIAKAGLRPTVQKAQFTLNADHTMSYSTSEVPGQRHYVLTGVGTWSTTDKEFTVTPLSMKLTDLPEAYIQKLQPVIDKYINKAQTGTFEWKGPDEFVVTKPKSVAQDFRRLK